MDLEDRLFLTSNCELFASSFELSTQLLSFLSLRNVFTHDTLSEILSIDDEMKRKVELILKLRTRGAEALREFLAILEITNQTEAVTLMKSRPPPQDQPRFRNHAIPDEPTLQISVRSATQLRSGPELFKMTSYPRGKCLIINNMDFGDLREYRKGSELDALGLNLVFQQLGYIVTLKYDLTSRKMIELLRCFAQDREHQSLDSCVIIILSHGRSGVVFGTDLGSVRYSDILEIFDNENCPFLKQKPKMFFIQACRGTNYSGVAKNNAYDSLPVPPPDDAESEAIERQKLMRMPSSTDILVSFSTVDGYLSARDWNLGTWYCQELIYLLAEKACDTDLETILKHVDRRVQQRMSDEGEMQATEWTLRGWNKILYFNPGLCDEL